MIRFVHAASVVFRYSSNLARYSHAPIIRRRIGGGIVAAGVFCFPETSTLEALDLYDLPSSLIASNGEVRDFAKPIEQLKELITELYTCLERLKAAEHDLHHNDLELNGNIRILQLKVKCALSTSESWLEDFSLLREQETRKKSQIFGLWPAVLGTVSVATIAYAPIASYAKIFTCLGVVGYFGHVIKKHQDVRGPSLQQNAFEQEVIQASAELNALLTSLDHFMLRRNTGLISK